MDGIKKENAFFVQTTLPESGSGRPCMDLLRGEITVPQEMMIDGSPGGWEIRDGKIVWVLPLKESHG